MTAIISPETNLGLYHRQHLKAQFRADIAAGTARPVVVPLDLFGPFLIPALYLSIPHTRRPWLYRLRFAVIGLMAWLNFSMMSRAASTNIAVAYATGLVGAWGTLWGLKVLIWTRPQFEAERVNRRLKPRTTESSGHISGLNSRANGSLTKRHPIGIVSNPSDARYDTQIQALAPDETVAEALAAGYEYYWQSYPSAASFSTRLDWALDHVTSFRGVGWTSSISPIPSFAPPSKPQSGCAVDLSSIPQHTRAGISRSLTIRSFLLNRLGHMGLSYLVVDICTVAMLYDPYFILGPDHAPYPLPSHLSSVPPPLLSLLRSVIALSAIVSALHLLFSFAQTAQFLLARSHPQLRALCGARADLWQYPSIFGSAVAVLELGLAGFWGGWWHQTFRAGFVAPTEWMVRRGWLPTDAGRRTALTKAVGGAVAFGLSGALHAAGSWTALSKTSRPWSPPVFFAGCWVGVLVQAAWSAAAGKLVREKCPVWVRRMANLLFVCAWLHFTKWALLDDLCRAGVWLYEPVPLSVVRLMGFGLPGDGAWRWDRDVWPKVWVAGRWWERGIAI